MRLEGLQAIGQLQNGTLGAIIAATLANLITAVEETGKPGSMTIKLDVKKVGAMVKIDSSCKDTTPTPKPDADMLYALDDGSLTHENPKQRKLELRPAEPPRSQVRERDDDEGDKPRLREATTGQ